MKKLACITALFTLALSCCMTACDSHSELSVYAPDGAPALALSKLLAEDTKEDGVRYNVVDPQTIKTFIHYKDKSKNADVCILPFTTATEELGERSDYQILGVVTHGNLYLVAKNKPTVTSVSNLSGETIGVLQLQSAPGQVFKSILAENNVTDVTLTGITGGADVGALNGVNYYLLAEPAATAQQAKGYSIVGNVQTLYGGENGFPQAVLVAKSSVIGNRFVWIRTLVDGIRKSSEYLQTATGEEIVSAISAHTVNHYQTTLKAPLLTTEVLARCGVYFTQSKDSKTEMQTFLQRVMRVDDRLTVVPDDDFYCIEDFNA